MLVAASHKNRTGPNEVVTAAQTDHHTIICRPYIPFCRFEAEVRPSIKIRNKVLTSKIFKIAFTYLEQVYHTKVLKVTYGGNQSLYKAALNSNLGNSGTIWLEYDLQSWSIVLGYDFDEKLQRAITFAIDCYEELN